MDTVESGLMTKDLAILAQGMKKPPRETWLDTWEFMDAIEATFKKAMGV